MRRRTVNRYKEIRAFVAVAKEASLSVAALKEKITPSMLSRRVDALEERLGVKLLHRTTRHLSLTEQGTIFLHYCHDLLTELDVGEAALFPNATPPTGHVSILAPVYFGRHHVAAHAKSFVMAYPKVQLSFNLTNEYIDPVEMEYDLCIRIGNVIDPNFVATKLLTNQRVVCATPQYFVRHGVPRILEDLTRHNCLTVNLAAGTHRDWLFQENGRPVSVKVNGNVDCNDGEVLVQGACDSLSLAWRSTWEVGARIASGELVTVLDEYALPSFDITAVYPRRKPLTAVKLFIQTLQIAYAQPGYWNDDSR